MSIMKTLTINGVTYNVAPVVPASTVTLLASAWKGDAGAYSQAVAIPGVTAHTKVDLQPTSEQLAEFHYKVLAFVAENEGGVVTVYAIGDKPTGDHTIQITLTEVEGVGKIRGNTVGTTMPRPDWDETDPESAAYIKNKPDLSSGGGGTGGEPGKDGVSVTHEWDGTTLIVTSASGTSSADLKGDPGEDGVSVTHRWEGTRLYVTSASGTSSADLQGPKGDKGDTGEGGGGGGGSSIWTEDTAYPGCFYRLVSTKYGEQYEWLNPPMTLDALYRTAERYNGKPVYKMVFDMCDGKYVNDDLTVEGTLILDWDADSGEFADGIDTYHVLSDNLISYSIEGFHIDFPDAPLTASTENWIFGSEQNGQLFLGTDTIYWSTEAALERAYMTVAMTLNGDKGAMD